MSLTLQPEPQWMTLGDQDDTEYESDEFDDYDEDDDFIE
jgi:hypothetical protein